MRMRKKKWARPYIAERDEVVVSDPEKLKGIWKKTLGVKVLHVEIGSGKGAYWIGMSKLYPEEGFVAIERSADAAAMGLKKCLEPTANMRLIVGDATLIDQWFAPGEIDIIHLNFSDPWPKKGHTKRRLTSDQFRDKYHALLSQKGIIIQKTDKRSLFEYSLESLTSGFSLEAKDDNYRSKPHPEDVITEYEQDFIDAGLPIYRAIWVKEEKE